MLMRSPVAVIILILVILVGRGSTFINGAPADTLAPAIPGVVAGGTKVQVIKDGFQGTEGPVAMPDGGILFTVRLSRNQNPMAHPH